MNAPLEMKMKYNKMTLKVFSALVLAPIMNLTPNAYAQLNKYKSKTQFNADKSSPSQSFTDDENNAQTFGNRTEKLPDLPDSKYVNLNLETGFGPEIVKAFNFPDTDIMELTRFMQDLTGINLILDKDVKGKVSITAPTPITVGDAWRAYLAALNMAGFTLVESGKFYKIINARDVRYVPTKIYTGAYTPTTEAHVMKVLALKNVDAAEISRNFRPFMSRYGRIIDIKQTNTIIISDTGTNIVRLEKLIKFLDVPGFEESLQIFQVRNSSAQEIAKLLDEILRGGSSSSVNSRTSTKRFTSTKSQTSGGGSNISKIIAEPRTNSIIAMANAAGADQLRDLIEKLDVKFTSNQADKIHVHYLQFGNAEELSKTLSSLVSGVKASANKSIGSSRSFITSGSDGSTLFNGEVKINADKNNNALVVTASPTDWLTMKNVIAKLDIPRDQVYVEGLIMETNITKQNAFGVEFAGAYGNGNAQRSGFSANGDIFKLLGGDPTSIKGFFAGIGGPEKSSRTFNIGGQDVKINSVNGLIKAIASNSNSNVLATPQILVMDNTEAEFEVGATVPVRNSSTTNGTVNTSTTNQEAKLSLKITPQINKVTRFVKLKIQQSISDFVGELDTSGNGLATNTRAANTEIMVRDKDTVAMGGLLRDRVEVSTNKVPLLGDIPVLGWLFKSKSKVVRKVNLLFFLTPTIISPYDNKAALNTQRVLDNRNENLQSVLTEEDTDVHAKEVKKLAEKFEQQVKGPLFENAPTYNDESNDEEIKAEVPDYKGIVQEVNNNKTL